ncbi:NUDIX hydrolase [candidate division TM7 genomosp. GTL1]|nr:NUDIX hydrolase [candidate division TM7 genomosp. GTL1]
MNKHAIHPTQMRILYDLRRVESARFSELMKPSKLESDVFKFHIKKLLKFGYIQKFDERYVLTPAGKEFANNLDHVRRVVQKQPKLSVLIVVGRTSDSGEPEFLFHQRKRHPYFDFWGFLSGPVQWGEAAAVTAARELKKQTGLEADFTVHAFYRQRDYLDPDGLVEDKLFIVARANNIRGEPDIAWSGGISSWMTPAECKQQEKYFASTEEVLDLKKGDYTSRDLLYNTKQY